MKSDDEIQEVRDRLLKKIEDLKRDKPEKWRQQVRNLCWGLYQLDRRETRESSEMRGRKAIRSFGRAPAHDNFEDNSWP